MTGENDPDASLSTRKLQLEESDKPAEPQHPVAPKFNKHDTPLFLPGHEHLPKSMYTDTTVAVNSASAKAARSANFKRLWLIVTVSWIVIAAIALGLLFFALPSIFSSRSTPQGHARTPSPTVILSPAATPSSLATQGSIPLAGLVITPDHFNVATDCQVDNGYRCTATLIASQSLQSSVIWYAYSSGITTRFNPPAGRISPGQQEQIIIYVYNQCPYSGAFIFIIGSNKMTLPLHC